MKLKSLFTIGLFGLVSLLTGCASVSKQATNIYPVAKPDEGLVYFYREKKMMGMVVSYNVREGEKIIGAIANGTYFFVYAEPGKHTYTASTEEESARTLDVEAGKIYYIEAGVEMGIFAGHPALKIASDAEAKSVLPTLTYAIK
jgi:hypothetical protein